MDSYTIATLNVNGMASPTRVTMLGKFLRTHDFDIAFLQEVTAPIDLHAFHYDTYLNIGGAGRGRVLSRVLGLTWNMLLGYRRVGLSLLDMPI
jgi:hypothetical protein